jgi:NADH dehydrogenase [ubiquinone] 1 alpha subcomplex assembly factor 7
MERLDAFMARANAAYYSAHDPFADFTTAPEISQVFGEILGLWAAVVWQGLGAPDPVLLVEAGPGRGTLMADALRAIGRVVPAFRAALRLHLIETSPRLRAMQANVLDGAVWHDALDTIPEAPLILLGNEFLDALPIRQFVRRGHAWAERFVDDGRFVEVTHATPPPLEGGGRGDRLNADTQRFGSPADPSPHSHPTGAAGVNAGSTTAAIPEGTILERNDSAKALIIALAGRFLAHPGAALFLDYGPAASAFGDSLQALRAGRPTNPLGPPGEGDLTAHVDFAALAAAAAANGAAVHGPLPQGVFLTRLGLFQRTGTLARGQPPVRATALVDAANRLAEPARMGRLFKALALCSPQVVIPPGFEPAVAA